MMSIDTPVYAEEASTIEEENMCTVVFMFEDSQVLTKTLKKGSLLSYPEDRELCNINTDDINRIIGWSYTFGVKCSFPIYVSGNLTLHALVQNQNSAISSSSSHTDYYDYKDGLVEYKNTAENVDPYDYSSTVSSRYSSKHVESNPSFYSSSSRRDNTSIFIGIKNFFKSITSRLSGLKNYLEDILTTPLTIVKYLVIGIYMIIGLCLILLFSCLIIRSIWKENKKKGYRWIGFMKTDEPDFCKYGTKRDYNLETEWKGFNISEKTRNFINYYNQCFGMILFEPVTLPQYDKSKIKSKLDMYHDFLQRGCFMKVTKYHPRLSYYKCVEICYANTRVVLCYLDTTNPRYKYKGQMVLPEYVSKKDCIDRLKHILRGRIVLMQTRSDLLDDLMPEDNIEIFKMWSRNDDYDKELNYELSKMYQWLPLNSYFPGIFYYLYAAKHDYIKENSLGVELKRVKPEYIQLLKHAKDNDQWKSVHSSFGYVKISSTPQRYC